VTTNVLRPVHYGLALVHLSRNEDGTETMCGLSAVRMERTPVWVARASEVSCEVCRRRGGLGVAR
jgi:hypothetical protein